MTVIELGEAAGLHHNTTREHLHALIDAGLVFSDPIPTTTKGRPKILYRAADQSDDPSRRVRLSAANARTEQLRRLLPLRQVSAPRTPIDDQLDMLDDHMDQCGFDVEIDVDATQMTMNSCPFADLARDNPQVCEVHFTLLRDALRLTDGPLEARAIHPFAGPNACTVEFGLATEPLP